MAKRFLFSFIFFLILAGGFGIYTALKYRQAARQAKLEQAALANKKQEISITLVEGLTNKQIGEYLAKQGIIDSANDFLLAAKNFDTSEYNSFLPEQAKGDLQGFLHPDTYRLFKDITDREKTTSMEAATKVIDKLLSTFGQKLTPNASQLAKAQGLNLYQAIILASIIEKETGRQAITEAQKQGLDSERAIIAGIFYNRLKIGMALESDATVNYVTGKSDPAVSQADTEINSPYNTYKFTGLPPTPICNPSLSSIMAALNPEPSDYLYFLHDQTTGKAYYAKTYEEHLANKQKYLR